MTTLSFSENLPALFEELEKLKQSFNFNAAGFEATDFENKENEKKFYKKNSYLFATTSASLFRLLPQIPYSKHKSIFEKLLFNLQLLDIEEKYAELFIENFEVIDTEESLSKAQKGQPFLFCCFHTGAYSLVPGLLASKSLDFGFLSNKTLTERKEKLYFEIHQRYCKKNKINSTPQFINVEDAKGIWKVIRMLKEGKSLIVYADGNTGSNYSKKESLNTVRVNFLGEDLRVRQGIAFLSYTCNIPIIPVLSSREDQHSELKLKRKYTLLPAIYPPKFTDKNTANTVSKEEFASQTMQKLYTILEKEITQDDKNSEQISKWEGWIFVNKFFEDLQKPLSLLKENKYYINKNDSMNKLYIFNEERFALIESQKNTLFDKFTYRFFPVSDLFYEIISYFSIPKKLYLLNRDNELTNEQIDETTQNNSHSPISTDFGSDSTLIHSQLQLSKTLIPISALEKLIEKNILVQHNEYF